MLAEDVTTLGVAEAAFISVCSTMSVKSTVVTVAAGPLPAVMLSALGGVVCQDIPDRCRETWRTPSTVGEGGVV
jgi:hypothetical protein